MEIFDVIDEHDHVIGQATRDECHVNPALVHRTVHFTLVDRQNRQIMVTRRALTKKRDGGKWCFLGEHVIAGETYEQTVRRGAEEELGVAASIIQEAGEHVFSEPKITERVKFFLVESGRDTSLRLDPREVDVAEWLTPEQLGTLTVSAMAKHWIENVEWAGFFDFDRQEQM